MTEQQGRRIIELLEMLVDIRSTRHRVDVDCIALDAARRIENIFVQSFEHGRTQRLAAIQIEILEAIKASGAAA